MLADPKRPNTRPTPVVGITPLGDLPPAGAPAGATAGLTHVVMFRLRRRDPSTRENLRRRLLALREQIPSLLAIDVGLDILGTERSFDVVLIARFANQKGLEEYQAHPAHQEVLAFLAEMGESAVAVDYAATPEEAG